MILIALIIFHMIFMIMGWFTEYEKSIESEVPEQKRIKISIQEIPKFKPRDMFPNNTQM